MKRSLVVMMVIACVFFMLGILSIAMYSILWTSNQASDRFTSKPAYDSGWINLTSNVFMSGPLKHLKHNLNTSELFVYVIGYKSNWGWEIEGEGISQINVNTHLGWVCNSSHIRLWWDDAILNWHEQVRVMIWKISEL